MAVLPRRTIGLRAALWYSLLSISTIVCVYLVGLWSLYSSADLTSPSHIEPETQTDSPPHQQPHRSKICLLIPWESHVPPYAHLWADSIRRNDPAMIRAYFVHHRKDSASVPSWAQTNSSSTNLHYIDLESLGSSYASRGFRGYYADRLCAFHTLYSPTTTSPTLCAEFEQHMHGAPHYLADTKGLIGLVFARWLNPLVCDSWAFADIDQIFGDFSKFFAVERNPLAWSADVWTIGDGDVEARFLHGQFTAHVFNPITIEGDAPPAYGAVNKGKPAKSIEEYENFENLEAYTSFAAYMHFRTCGEAETMQKMRDAYSWNIRLLWDEGCYSIGIYTHNYRVLDFSLQATSGTHPLAIYRGKSIFACSKHNINSCLLGLPRNPTPPIPFTAALSTFPIVATQDGCMQWLYRVESRYCAKDVPANWKQPLRRPVAVHFGNGSGEFRDFEGERRAPGNMLDVREYAVFHWQYWKAEMVPKCDVEDWVVPKVQGWRDWLDLEFWRSAIYGKRIIAWGDRIFDMNYVCTAAAS